MSLNPAGPVEFVERIVALFREEAAAHGVTLGVDGHGEADGRTHVDIYVTFPPVLTARFNAIFGKEP